MTFEEARQFLEEIEGSQLTTLRQDLLIAASRYAAKRVEWYLADTASRQAMDTARTAAHDAFIDTCNILSRNMTKVGEDNRWRARLGDDRKAIGDFACYLHALLGVRAR